MSNIASVPAGSHGPQPNTYPVGFVTVALDGSGNYNCTANTNDQSTTTQDVINLAFTNLSAAGGGTLWLKAGTYYIKTPGIKIPSNCSLVGEGNSTVLYYANSSAFTGLIHNAEAILVGQTNTNTNIRIANLFINGNSVNAGGNPPRDAIWLKMCSDSIVENVHLYDCSDSAIVLDQPQTSGCIIRSNIIDTTLDIGIYVSDASNNVIIGNVIRNAASYGIRLIRRTAGACEYNIANSNYVYNCGQTNNVDGIMLDNADLSEVTGNYVIQSGRNGINIQGTYCTVASNNVDLSDAHGIFADTGVRCTISSNTVNRSSQSAANTYSGITLNAGSDCTIVGNRSGDVGSGTRQRFGIQELGTSDNNVIVGNNCRMNSAGSVSALGVATINASNL